ncbi:hypothetical protein NPIL_267723 [Nephila pilipes]|uniref:Uncharacterized protein n=1 Tax=Nephila pilipes TaxID=299642 RepID=A0A8X6MQ09_NEPPI|nr:hypothetical protein NPIL_267723 [Nephila pilipes]
MLAEGGQWELCASPLTECMKPDLYRKAARACISGPQDVSRMGRRWDERRWTILYKASLARRRVWRDVSHLLTQVDLLKYLFPFTADPVSSPRPIAGSKYQSCILENLLEESPERSLLKSSCPPRARSTEPRAAFLNLGLPWPKPTIVSWLQLNGKRI